MIRVEWWRWEFTFHAEFLHDLMHFGELEDWVQREVKANLRSQGGVGEPSQTIWRVRSSSVPDYVRLVVQGHSGREIKR